MIESHPTEGDAAAPVEPLVFRGRLSEDDAVAVRRLLNRLLIPRPLGWAVVALSTSIVILGLAMLLMGFVFEQDTAFIAYVVTAIGIILWAYLIWLSPVVQARSVRRSYRRNADKYLESQVTLSEGRVAIENEAARSEFRWDLVGLIVDTPDGLLFCNAAKQALFWLPDRLLDGTDARRRILALGASNGVRVRRFA